MSLHKWNQFKALKENLTENNYGKVAFDNLIQRLFDNEHEHYTRRREKDHIYKNYLACKEKNFYISKCIKEIANIIQYYDYDECKDFHENEFPKNHIYRDIKRLRAYMLATYPEFGDIYHGDGLWEQTEDITEPEFDENDY